MVGCVKGYVQRAVHNPSRIGVLALSVVVAGLLGGCGGSDTPFFVIRNDRAADVYVTYCATQACPAPATRLIPVGKTWRVSNLSDPNSGGYVFVTVAGRQVGCTLVAPALTMVDRLVYVPISSFIVNSCAGYDPRRLHLPLRASRV
jgi:hypothetical protein